MSTVCLQNGVYFLDEDGILSQVDCDIDNSNCLLDNQKAFYVLDNSGQANDSLSDELEISQDLLESETNNDSDDTMNTQFLQKKSSNVRLNNKNVTVMKCQRISAKLSNTAQYGTGQFLNKQHVSRNSNCSLKKHKYLHRNQNSSDLKDKIKLTKIPPDDYKKQITDTSDITNPLILMPHTKNLMKVSFLDLDKIFMMPQHTTISKHSNLFERNCISKLEPDELDPSELNLMPLGYKPQIDLSKIKRIVRRPKNPSLYQHGKNVDGIIERYASDTTECIIDDSKSFGNDIPQSYFTTVSNEEIIVMGKNQNYVQQNMRTESYKDIHSNNIDVLLAAAANTPDSYCD